MIRQKLASVELGSPSFLLKRINGFSPVKMTGFGSATLIEHSSVAAGVRDDTPVIVVRWFPDTV
jgi:hypothetical protein